MKIELIRTPSFYASTGISGKVSWIKQVREDLGIGLKAAKHLADQFDLTHRDTFIIDTNGLHDLDVRQEVENAFLVRFSQNVRPIPVIEEPLLSCTVYDPKKVAEDYQVDESDAVLKNAAIKLIRLGSFEQARDVLKILI